VSGDYLERMYVIPADPIPYNNCYPTSRSGFRYLSGDAKALKMFITSCLEGYDRILYHGSKFKLRTGAVLCFDLCCIYQPNNLHYKNGSVKRKDVSGFVKLVEDAVSEYLGIDDSINRKVIAEKIEADNVDYGTTIMVVKLSAMEGLCQDPLLVVV